MKRTVQVYLGDTARNVGSLRFDAQGARRVPASNTTPTGLLPRTTSPLNRACRS